MWTLNTVGVCGPPIQNISVSEFFFQRYKCEFIFSRVRERKTREENAYGGPPFSSPLSVKIGPIWTPMLTTDKIIWERGRHERAGGLRDGNSRLGGAKKH